jgi:hypothetical protein
LRGAQLALAFFSGLMFDSGVKTVLLWARRFGMPTYQGVWIHLFSGDIARR